MTRTNRAAGTIARRLAAAAGSVPLEEPDPAAAAGRVRLLRLVEAADRHRPAGSFNRGFGACLEGKGYTVE